MSTPEPRGAQDDVSRRTWLAQERTWLAWWRTGLGAAAVGIAVGRLLPVTGEPRWPYALLGVAYGGLAVAMLVAGAMRHRRSAAALRSGGFAELSDRLVLGLTAIAVGLSFVTLILVAVDA